eukprot:TRINITY_DN2056_c1_g1_i1.p1 TRINITY_DN2056_c1_g1~~TRINITY_DN2056_c1_g1_i1.p1  ORF type:complete len:738 (+),score=146.98 TRINITY_DN2056_c1_g1_i1:43-2256(+)
MHQLCNPKRTILFCFVMAATLIMSDRLFSVRQRSPSLASLKGDFSGLEITEVSHQHLVKDADALIEEFTIVMTEKREESSRYLDFVADAPPTRLQMCLNEDAVITSNITLWSIPNRDDNGSSIASLELLLKNANTNSKVPFSPVLLDVVEDALSDDNKQRLKDAGWTICTVNRVGPPGELFSLVWLWDTPATTAVFISPNTYISGSITTLLATELPKTARIGATLDYKEASSSWAYSFNPNGVFKIHPNTNDRDTLRGKLKSNSKLKTQKGWSAVLNMLWYKNWYEIGFHHAANTALFRTEPLFWKSRSYDFRIIHYTKDLPWKVESTDEPFNWWKNELQSKDANSSLYYKLWGNMGIQSFGNETPVPLQYSPDPTPDPLPRNHHQAPERSTQDPDTLRIQTTDRRSIRIERRIMDIHRDLFPDDAPVDRRWTITIGIPSIDTERGQLMRYVQRSSCFAYDSVWNYKKRDDSRVVVKYLLGYHPENNYTISQRVKEEGQITKDIVFFNVREGPPAAEGEELLQRKPIAMLVGMSRKTYAWFAYVADRFKTDYAIKGDDDAYFRVNLLLRELTSYRFPKVYYGRGMIYQKLKYGFRVDGPLIALSYDLVDWIRDSKIAEEYTDFAFEDILPLIWMHGANIQANNISDCRLKQANETKTDDNSAIQIHGLKQPEQFAIRRRHYQDDHVSPIKVQSGIHLEKGDHIQFNKRNMCQTIMVKKLKWKLRWQHDPNHIRNQLT